MFFEISAASKKACKKVHHAKIKPSVAMAVIHSKVVVHKILDNRFNFMPLKCYQSFF